MHPRNYQTFCGGWQKPRSIKEWRTTPTSEFLGAGGAGVWRAGASYHFYLVAEACGKDCGVAEDAKRPHPQAVPGTSRLP